MGCFYGVETGIAIAILSGATIIPGICFMVISNKVKNTKTSSQK